MPRYNPDPETGHDGALELGEDAFGNEITIRWEEESNVFFVYVNGESVDAVTASEVRGLSISAPEAAELQD